jgi:gamma-glutamylcyclotransferase (GGCT)/AIG2-like uncharacterized protein YtfP
METVSDIVFVYGSLKRGARHHDLMGEARFLALTAVHGFGLYRVGRYPAMAPLVGARVPGELYVVDAAHLARLDEFEDCPELYQRVEVRLGDGRVAWAYTMTAERVRGAARLPGDAWTG